MALLFPQRSSWARTYHMTLSDHVCGASHAAVHCSPSIAFVYCLFVFFDQPCLHLGPWLSIGTAQLCTVESRTTGYKTHSIYAPTNHNPSVHTRLPLISSPLQQDGSLTGTMHDSSTALIMHHRDSWKRWFLEMDSRHTARRSRTGPLASQSQFASTTRNPATSTCQKWHIIQRRPASISSAVMPT